MAVKRLQTRHSRNTVVIPATPSSFQRMLESISSKTAAIRAKERHPSTGTSPQRRLGLGLGLESTSSKTHVISAKPTSSQKDQRHSSECWNPHPASLVPILIPPLPRLLTKLTLTIVLNQRRRRQISRITRDPKGLHRHNVAKIQTGQII